MSAQPQFVVTPKALATVKQVKTPFTGQTMMFTADEAVEYEKLAKMCIESYRPVTFREELLVQSIIDSEWRCRGISVMQQAILAVGRLELAESTPAHLLPAAVYLKYQRQIKDLSMQENRLRRYRDADLKELQAAQSARREREMLRRKMEQQQPPESEPQPQTQAASAAAPATFTPARC